MPDPALANISQGFAVSDIVAAVITTASKAYLFKTASLANIKPRIEAGQWKPLRKINAIHAVNKTEDLITGYDIDLTDVLLHMELVGIVNGGVATFSGEGDFTGYTGPVAGQPQEKTPFKLELYSAVKDTAGANTSYMKWGFPACVGKPMEFDLQDGEFYAAKMPLYNAPANGTAPMEITPVETLPVVA